MILFVTAVDTGVGKTYATGLLGRYLRQTAASVITMKLAQTDCEGISEDIVEHRRLMGIDLTPDDITEETCPYCFPLPASPHLAARDAGAEIEPERLIRSVDLLAARYEHVLIEGVGGLCVPLTRNTTILDFLAATQYQTLVVTTPRLGSINHTLLTLEALRTREVPIAGVLYNHHEETAPVITKDSRTIFQDWLKQNTPTQTIIDLPHISGSTVTDVDFSGLLQHSSGTVHKERGCTR